MNVDLLLLQISDTALPIGGFSHSFGLESFVQEGLVCDSDSVLLFMHSYILEPLLYNDLLSIRYIYECSDVDEILELEHVMFVQTLSCEIREGNGKLGRRFVKIANKILQNPSDLWNLYATRTSHPTHASAFGVLCVSVGIECDRALRHYAYTQVSSMVINAVKLIPLSQESGQEILSKLHDSIELALERLGDLVRFGSADSLLNACNEQHRHVYPPCHVEQSETSPQNLDSKNAQKDSSPLSQNDIRSHNDTTSVMLRTKPETSLHSKQNMESKYNQNLDSKNIQKDSSSIRPQNDLVLQNLDSKKDSSPLAQNDRGRHVEQKRNISAIESETSLHPKGSIDSKNTRKDSSLNTQNDGAFVQNDNVYHNDIKIQNQKRNTISQKFGLLGIGSMHYDIMTMRHEILYSRLYMS